MLLLVIGLLIFFGVHLVPANPKLRNDLRIRFGTLPYQIAFTLISFIGLGLIIYGYGKVQFLVAKNPQLWMPPVWSKHLLWTLMLPASILLAASNIPSRIRTAVGHPMLIATMIWSAGHLLANGSAAALLLFGTFLAWAIFDYTSVKRRNAKGPLGSREGTVTGDLIAIGIGGAFWAFMLLGGHGKLIGVPLMP